jgi:hypothetical protein
MSPIINQSAALDLERLRELALDLGQAVADLSGEVAELHRRVDAAAPVTDIRPWLFRAEVGAAVARHDGGVDASTPRLRPQGGAR